MGTSTPHLIRSLFCYSPPHRKGTKSWQATMAAILETLSDEVLIQCSIEAIRLVLSTKTILLKDASENFVEFPIRSEIRNTPLSRKFLVLINLAGRTEFHQQYRRKFRPKAQDKLFDFPGGCHDSQLRCASGNRCCVADHLGINTPIFILTDAIGKVVLKKDTHGKLK